MNGKQLPGRRRRRSQEEVERLVAEYEASGLGGQAFCQTHGLSLSTLNRYRKRQQMPSEPAETSGWVAVELSDAGQAPASQPSSELSVLLSGGRRIEVRGGFDPKVLQKLVRVLEQA
jgi:transposase-like protein